MRIAIIGALTLLVLAGCGRFSFLTSGSEGYLSTQVCGVHVNGKTREARLRIDLVPTARLPRNALLEVEFENPAAGSAPLVANRVFAGDERTIVVFSPPVANVRARGYEVVARIYSAADKKQVLGILTHVCPSLVDQRELPR